MFQFWSFVIVHSEMKFDPKTRKNLFYPFNFTTPFFCRWKRPFLWVKEQLKFCSQACASAEVTVRVTAAVMNFSMKIVWTSPHSSKNWLLLPCISHSLLSDIRWQLLLVISGLVIDTEMLSSPKDYKSITSWIWAATWLLPSSITVCEKVSWPLGC